MSKDTQDELGHLKKEEKKLRRLMYEYLRTGESEELFWIIKSKQKLNVFVICPHGSVQSVEKRRKKTLKFKEDGSCISVMIIFGGVHGISWIET